LFELADKCNPAAHGRIVGGAPVNDVRREMYELVGLLLGVSGVRKENP
jgi:hypothetical protein